MDTSAAVKRRVPLAAASAEASARAICPWHPAFAPHEGAVRPPVVLRCPAPDRVMRAQGQLQSGNEFPHSKSRQELEEAACADAAGSDPNRPDGRVGGTGGARCLTVVADFFQRQCTCPMKPHRNQVGAGRERHVPQLAGVADLHAAKSLGV